MHSQDCDWLVATDANCHILLLLAGVTLVNELFELYVILATPLTQQVHQTHLSKVYTGWHLLLQGIIKISMCPLATKIHSTYVNMQEVSSPY